MTVIEEIGAERRRQIADEGWTAEHDDCHNNNELADAASCYALSPSERLGYNRKNKLVHISQCVGGPMHWPFDDSRWKSGGRRRELIKAAALLVAEIERIDRLSYVAVAEPYGVSLTEFTV